MNGWFETALLAFADYYVACTFLLVIALIGIRLVAQPIRRIAACWATIVALALLIPATLMPIWPRIAWEQVIDLPTTATPPVDSTPVMLPIAAIENDARNQTTQESIANNASDPTTEPDNNVAQTSPADIDDSLVSNTPPFPTTTNTQPNTLVSPKATVSSSTTYAGIIAGGLFLSGIALAFAWMVAGGLLARRLQRQCAPAPESVQAQLNQLAANSPHTPPVLVHQRINTAVAMNALRPTIVLPELFVQRAPKEEMHYALAHELAHIRHRDLWLLNAGRMLFVLLYAHPLFWWLRRVIRDNQELLADAYAAQETERHKYARALLNLARLGIDGPVPRLAAVGIWERPSQLTRRIKTLLDEQFTVKLNCSRAFRASTFSCAIGLMVVCSLLTLRAPSESEAVAAAVGSESGRGDMPLILSEDTRDSPGTTDTLPAASDLAQVEGNREQPDAAPPQDPRTLGGIVVDPDGKPVPKAMILMANGRNYFKDYGNDLIPLTDADGNFRVEDLDPGLYKFTVFSPDWALQTYQVNIPLAAPLKLTMNKGTRVEFRTVDADGKPISGIKFHPEAPRNGPFTGDPKLNYLHVLDFLSHRYLIGNESDKQGRVIWENAPPDSLGYQIYGNGYMSHMGEDFGPKGSPHTLVFRPTIPVIGTVTDAETAEPVADFDVFQGTKFKSNSSTIPYSWSPERQKTKQPGQFQGTIHNLNRVSCFRIQAKGYRPAITKVLDAANLPDEPIKLDVRLKKDAPYIGKILRPDGQPAVGAAVHIISAEARKRSFATLSNGVFDYPGIHVQTESGNDGAIQIAAHNEPFICCIVHDAGYAQVTDVDLYSMKSIKLDAWAQIEGRTVINGKPAAGVTVRITQGDLFRVGIFPSLVSSTSQTTDENGLYRFEKCVPGRWLRTITFSDAADSDMRGYRISEHVVLQPGETLTAQPNPASTELFGRILLPNDDAVIDAEQSDVYLIKEVSAESAPESHRRLSHRAPLQQDGTFRFYGISAGDYRVTVSAKIKGDESPKSNYSKTVQVKQTAFTDQADTAGIDVGLLEVEEQPLPN